jgi:hypothetical protein
MVVIYVSVYKYKLNLRSRVGLYCYRTVHIYNLTLSRLKGEWVVHRLERAEVGIPVVIIYIAVYHQELHLRHLVAG